MVRFSISQLTTMRWSFHQDVLRYMLQGFQSIGVWRHKLDELDVFEVADYLHEMKIGVSSVHWAGGFTGSCGFTFKQALQDGVEAIEMASRLDGNVLIVHPGSRNGHTCSHARRLLKSGLENLVHYASDYGIRLAIELMPGADARQWTFIRQIQETLELVHEFPQEQIGVVLDLYHIGLNEEVFNSLSKFANRIALVQLADRSNYWEPTERRLALGEGQVPFEKWFNRLHQLGYNGMYEVELHGEGVAQVDYESRLDAAAQFIVNNSAAPCTEMAAERIEVRRPWNRNP